MDERIFAVYIMTNPSNTVFYTGVTSNLMRRVYEHKTKAVSGFTLKYNCVKLIYYETGTDAEGAILREKQIKAGSRLKKVALIETMNPTWEDLSEEI